MKGRCSSAWQSGLNASREARREQPTVVDFDDGEISCRLDGKELRGWIYTGTATASRLALTIRIERRRRSRVRLVSDSRIVPLIAHRSGKLDRRRARIKAEGEQLEFVFAWREK